MTNAALRERDRVEGSDASPDLSIVIPSVNGSEPLRETLAALQAQSADASLEVLVPERCGPEVRNTIEKEFPRARIIPVEPATPIPIMRHYAFQEARGTSVAVIEDHVIVDEDWVDRILAARGDGADVVGGSVYNAATDTLLDRAAFLCEYSHDLNPREATETSALPGNNVAYDRELLSELQSVTSEGRWEDHLHQAMHDRSARMVFQPEIRAGHKMHYQSAAEYAEQRLLYSRAFSAMRLADSGLVPRVGYAVATIVLPLVLAVRILSRAWRGGTPAIELVRSLPYILYFVSAWAAGEAAGALFGAGDALGRVR